MANVTKVGRVHVTTGNITTAVLNVPTTVCIVPADVTRTIHVTGGWMRALGGSASVATGVNVTDDTGTVAVAFLIAALTSGTMARLGDTNVTLTNVGSGLHQGEGLNIKQNGVLTTATSVDYCIEYVVT